jgi:hypothetical protein
MSAYSSRAAAYFAAHAIDPAVAAGLGVAERNGSLVFTVRRPGGRGSFQRSRALAGCVKVLQPKGEPLTMWWPAHPPEFAPTVLLAEGEGDALTVIGALASRPIANLPEHAVAALPGTGFPPRRVAAELLRVECKLAYLAFDGDPAGWRLTRTVGWELDPLGIRVAPLAIPEGADLADVLAATEPERRGERFAELLLGTESPPTIARAA